MAGSGNRTEKPTPRRLERARKEGNFVSSKEFVSAAQFLVFSTFVLAGFPGFFLEIVQQSRGLLRLALTPMEIQREGLTYLFRQRLAPLFASLVGTGLSLTAAAFAAQMVVSQLGIAAGKLTPDLQRLNPMKRITEVPSQNLSQFMRSVVLLPIFLGATGWLVWKQAPHFLMLPLLPWWTGVTVVGQAIRTLLERALYVFLLLGLFDWMRQHKRYMKQLNMSKQEIRDENKEVEGNPQIKAKVRKMQRDMSRRRMMSDVPKASAVIVNPTHYAVAIRYDLNDMAAPKIVAKGRNHVARRIRELAIASEVPIIENPPLARALFAASEVGQEIPPHLYKVVAEILAYLYRILGGRLPGQATT